MSQGFWAPHKFHTLRQGRGFWMEPCGYMLPAGAGWGGTFVTLLPHLDWAKFSLLFDFFQNLLVERPLLLGYGAQSPLGRLQQGQEQTRQAG